MSDNKKNNSANNTSASDNTRAASEGAGEQDLKALLGVDGEEDKVVKAIYTGSVDADTLPEKKEPKKKNYHPTNEILGGGVGSRDYITRGLRHTT